MKYRIPLLVPLIGASLLFTGAAPAQQSMQSPSGTDSQTFNTAQGQVTIHSTMGQPPSAASPPSFEQLSGGKKVITREQAVAFSPLANDFSYASHGGNSISKTQYERWLKDLN